MIRMAAPEDNEECLKRRLDDKFWAPIKECSRQLALLDFCFGRSVSLDESVLGWEILLARIPSLSEAVTHMWLGVRMTFERLSNYC